MCPFIDVFLVSVRSDEGATLSFCNCFRASLAALQGVGDCLSFCIQCSGVGYHRLPAFVDSAAASYLLGYYKQRSINICVNVKAHSSCVFTGILRGKSASKISILSKSLKGVRCPVVVARLSAPRFSGPSLAD
jgi:hypothetical protein